MKKYNPEDDIEHIEFMRRYISCYDSGEASAAEIVHSVNRRLLYSAICDVPLRSITAGIYRGPEYCHYMMIEMGPMEEGYYTFSFMNVCRFYWNKLVRVFRLYRLQWIW